MAPSLIQLPPESKESKILKKLWSFWTINVVEVGFIYLRHVSKAGTMNGWLQASLAQLKIMSSDMNIISVRCFQQTIKNANNDPTGRSLPPLIKGGVPSRHNSSFHFLLVEVKHNGIGRLDDIIRARARPSSACS